MTKHHSVPNANSANFVIEKKVKEFALHPTVHR